MFSDSNNEMYLDTFIPGLLFLEEVFEAPLYSFHLSKLVLSSSVYIKRTINVSISCVIGIGQLGITLSMSCGVY